MNHLPLVGLSLLALGTTAAAQVQIPVNARATYLRTENDPFARLLVKAQHALLGDHPYGYDPSGSKADVAGDGCVCQRVWSSSKCAMVDLRHALFDDLLDA